LLLFLALAGAADELSAIFRSTLWNATIPDALRGRLAGIELISYSSGPTLGNVESGVVASLFGVRASIISGGALCVAGVVGLALALPSLLAFDKSGANGRERPAVVCGPVARSRETASAKSGLCCGGRVRRVDL